MRLTDLRHKQVRGLDGERLGRVFEVHCEGGSVSALMVGGDRHRLLRGGAVEPPKAFQLRHLLEEDGTLFCRYTRAKD